jgi:hypothetical protein
VNLEREGLIVGMVVVVDLVTLELWKITKMKMEEDSWFLQPLL